MLRILIADADAAACRLRVEGTIAGEAVTVLAREIRAALESSHTVTLDFAAVDFLDGDGVRMLATFPKARVPITGCSTFVAALLE